MLDQQREVNDAFTCFICSGKFNDPRILPCGASACHKCIQKKSLLSTNMPGEGFECPYCYANHQSANERHGFPSNLVLLKLLEAKVDDVYRSRHLDELRLTLTEIRVRFEEFSNNLNNGEEQTKGYCDKLRGQVDSHTDELIDRAREFNKQLMEEIDRFEQSRVKAYRRNSMNYRKSSNLYLEEVNRFYVDRSKWLSESKFTDDRAIEQSLAMAKNHLKELDRQDCAFKHIKFDRIMMQFNKSKLEQRMLGSFLYKQMAICDEQVCVVYVDNFNDQRKNCQLFKLENGNALLFEVDKKGFLNTLKHDARGTMLDSKANIAQYQISYLKVSKFKEDSFAVCISLVFNPPVIHFCTHSQPISCSKKNGHLSRHLCIIADEALTYRSHKALDGQFLHIAANSSNIVAIDAYFDYHFMDASSLDPSEKPLKSIIDHVGQTVVAVEMTEDHVLFLCDTRRLKIFDLVTFDLVKEIGTDADQMKLVMDTHFVLFDSMQRVIVLFDQCGFERLDIRNVRDTIESGFCLSKDRTRFITFYNCMHGKLGDAAAPVAVEQADRGDVSRTSTVSVRLENKPSLESQSKGVNGRKYGERRYTSDCKLS
jgi:hypothetical protein